VSRIADYLETDRAIDRARLIVTGASRAGKAAMVAAAFDERLMVPGRDRRGGVGAYRFSGAAAGARGPGPDDDEVPELVLAHLHESGAHGPAALRRALVPRAVRTRPSSARGDTDGVSLPNAVEQSILAARPPTRSWAPPTDSG